MKSWELCISLVNSVQTTLFTTYSDLNNTLNQRTSYISDRTYSGNSVVEWTNSAIIKDVNLFSPGITSEMNQTAEY